MSSLCVFSECFCYAVQALVRVFWIVKWPEKKLILLMNLISATCYHWSLSMTVSGSVNEVSSTNHLLDLSCVSCLFYWCFCLWLSSWRFYSWHLHVFSETSFNIKMGFSCECLSDWTKGKQQASLFLVAFSTVAIQNMVVLSHGRHWGTVFYVQECHISQSSMESCNTI